MKREESSKSVREAESRRAERKREEQKVGQGRRDHAVPSVAAWHASVKREEGEEGICIAGEGGVRES